MMQTTSNRRAPLPYQKWEHFKGSVYTVRFVTQAGPPSPVKTQAIEAQHTEHESRIVTIFFDALDNAWADDGKEYAVYEKDGDLNPWARPSQDFLGVHPSGAQRFRLWMPGSDACIEAGCKCPVLDNGHGWRDPRCMVINGGCPIHGFGNRGSAR